MSDSGPRCVVFDIYGTLLDVASPVARLADRVGAQQAHLADLWRAKQLEYAWVATLTGRYETFWTLTERALHHALGALNLDGDAGLAEALLDAYRAPDVYPEVADALAALRTGGHRLAAFSNADPAMLTAALDAGGLTPLLDDVVSVDPVRRFKPHADVYAHCQTALGETAERLVFLSSNGWDVTGAETFGWRALWVNRKGAAFEFGPRAEADSIAALDDLPARLPVSPSANPSV
jgi:2-haloacid dehalogenase